MIQHQALGVSGQVYNDNGNEVSPVLSDAFETSEATGQWQATVTDQYRAATTALQADDRGADEAQLGVTFYGAPAVPAIISLLWVYLPQAAATITGPTEMATYSRCQFVGSVPGRTVVRWEWYLDGAFQNDAQTFYLPTGEAGIRYEIYMRAVDDGGWTWETVVYPFTTGTAPAEPDCVY